MDLVLLLYSHFSLQLPPSALLFLFFILYQNRQRLLSLLLKNSFDYKYRIQEIFVLFLFVFLNYFL